MSIFNAFSKHRGSAEESPDSSGDKPAESQSSSDIDEASRDSDTGEGRPERNVTAVPWGPVGATLVAVTAILGADVLVFLLVAGGVVLEGSMSLPTAQRVIEASIPLLFTAFVGARLFAIALVYWFVRRRGGGWRTLGVRGFRPGRGVVVVVLGFIGFFITAAVATVLLEHFAPGVDLTAEQEIPFLAARQAWEIVLAFLALVVIAPVSEELVFRGLLLPAFGKVFGLLPSVVIISIGFGLLHPPLSAMIIIGLFAIFLGIAYVATKSVWPPIALHASKNLLAFFLSQSLPVGMALGMM